MKKDTISENDHTLNPTDHNDTGLHYFFLFLPGVHTWVKSRRAPASVL